MNENSYQPTNNQQGIPQTPQNQPQTQSSQQATVSPPQQSYSTDQTYPNNQQFSPQAAQPMYQPNTQPQVPANQPLQQVPFQPQPIQQQIPAQQQPVLTSNATEGWKRRIDPLIYLFLAFIETLLILRMIFRLLQASTANSIIAFIFNSTNQLILPFEGIFGATPVDSLIEIPVILALIMYALLAVGISRLARIFLN